MADNVAITAGAGTNIATDQLVGGEHVQYIKLMDGTLDSSNKAVVNASGNLTIKVNEALPTGANVIGGVTQSGTWNIGSITTLPSIPAGTNLIGNVKVSDGTNTAAVKAASTAAIATDTALVVAVSPNNTIAATQSGTWNVGLSAGTNYAGKVRLTDGTTDTSVIATIGSLKSDTSSVAGTATATGNGTASAGCQRVTIASDNTAFTVNATATGNVAHDAADSGNPVKIGGKARTANPTAAANGDRVDAYFDTAGRQVVVMAAPRDLTGVQQTTITSSTAETTIVTAAGAGVFADITHLSITNGSATATIVTLKDSTAGTTRGIWNLSAGGGVVLPFPTPLKQATANNNWTLTCGTSVASVYVVAQFVQNA